MSQARPSSHPAPCLSEPAAPVQVKVLTRKAYFLRIICVAFCLSATAGRAPADSPTASPLGRDFPYPADAQIVVAIKGIQAIQDHFHEFAQAAFPKQATRWRDQLGKELASSLLKDRSMRALKPEARIYFVIHNFGEELDDFQWSLLLPVQSYKDFCTSFLTPTEQRARTKEGAGIEAVRTTVLMPEETTVFLSDLGEYVAICSELEVARKYGGKYIRGSTQALGPKLTEAFLKADLAVYVNAERLVQRYAEELRALKGLLDFALQQVEQEIPQLDPAERDLIKKMIPALFQALEDSQALVLGLEFGAKGVQLNMHVRFGENTPSSRVLAREKGLPWSEWEQLPAGMPIYFALSTGGELGKLFAHLTQNFRAADEDPTGQRLVKMHQEDIEAAGLQMLRGCWSMPLRGLTIARYRDPDKALRAYVKLHKALEAGAHAHGQPLKTRPGIREAAEQHRGFTFTEIRLHFDWEKLLENIDTDQQEIARDILRRMVPERTTMWVGVVEKDKQKELVELWANNWDDARQLLDRFLDGKETLATRPEFALMREQLASSGSGNLFDLRAMIPFALDFIELMKLDNNQLPSLKKTQLLRAGPPAYTALVYHCQEEVFTLQLYCTPESIAIVSQFLEPLLKSID